MKNCETCRWAGCKNYGSKSGACIKYIMSLEEEKQIKEETETRKALI